MKPFDPRLLRYARAARGVLVTGGLLGFVRTIAILAWSWCLAAALTVVVLPALRSEGGGSGRVAEGAPTADALPWLLGGALLALCVRSLAAWGMDTSAARGAVQVKAQLRMTAIAALDSQSPVRDDQRSEAELTTVLGRGLDALDGYFSGYVPQLILTAVATPILIIAVLVADPLSGVVVLIVFPVIPIFMILIGMATQAVQDRQWAQLQRLSSSFVDAVSGLATLKIFRREGRQAGRITTETEEYRSRTMRVLRVTFLSGFVLDLAGTFSIALVAVTVGTRLVSGEFPLLLGLFVLLLLPEVFIPIRQVGAAFHASTEGLAAAGDVFTIIEGNSNANEGTTGNRADPGVQATLSDRIEFVDAIVHRGGRQIVGPVSFTVEPGEVVALTGPSGAGKSTLIAAALGFVPLSSGAVSHPGRLAWAGQRPGLLQGTIGDNVVLGDTATEHTPDAVRRALDRAGAPELDHETELGALGAGLSGGQAQRVAIARALFRADQHDGAALLLDEPSSALDADHEAHLAATLRAEAKRGRPVLVVSHREALISAADRVIRVQPAEHQAQQHTPDHVGEPGEGIQ